MKGERSGSEEHAAAVTVTDTPLARRYASLHCSPLHLTLPPPPPHLWRVCVRVYKYVFDLILSTTEDMKSSESDKRFQPAATPPPTHPF